METPNKTAALVTPDRALARRVLAALSRWNVPVDDSGGDALADTPPGVFARLVAEAALDGLPPVTLLAMLKHEQSPSRPPRRGGAGRRGAARLAAEEGQRGAGACVGDIPRGAWKIPAPRASSLHHTHTSVLLTDAELNAAAALTERLKTALAPLEALSGKRAPFARLREMSQSGAGEARRHR